MEREKADVATSSSALLTSFFDTLEKSQVLYCVLRNYDMLPEKPGNDVDILVQKGHLAIATKKLNETAKACGWIRLATVCRYGYAASYFVPNSFSCAPLMIDICDGFYLKGVPTASAEVVLETRKRYKGFFVAAPGVEATTVLLKELLRFGTIKERNNARSRIKSLADSDPHNFIACIEPHFGPKLSMWLLDKTKQGAWGQIESRYKHLRRVITRRAFINNPVQLSYNFCRFIWSHIVYRFTHPLGFFVVLIGPDGSGKTTIARQLESVWRRCFSKECVHVHGNFNIIPRLQSIRRFWSIVTRKPVKPRVDFTQKHSGVSVKPHSLFRSLVYLSYYIWDYIIGHLWVFYHKGKDHLIVADRYFYDYFFQLANKNIPSSILYFLRRLVPKPDLIVYLERDPENIYKAKDELPVYEIERQQAILSKLADKIPDVIRIKGDTGVEATVQAATCHIFRRILDKAG